MRDPIGRYEFTDEQRKLARTLKLGFPAGQNPGEHKALPTYKFTADEYMRLAEAGVLSREDRVELVDGVIVNMAPTGRPHGRRTHRIARLFGRILPDDIEISVQSTIRLNNLNAPEPDIALLTPEASLDEQNIPRPEDILLIVEVSDSTLPRDRREKARRYAESGIPELWILMVKTEEIEVHRQPTPSGYANAQRYRRGDTLTIQALPGISLAVDDLLQ